MSEMNHLGDNALAVRRIRSLVWTLVLVVLSVVVPIGVGRVIERAVPWWPFTLVAAAVGVAGWWWAKVVNDRWAWRLTDDLFEVTHGVLIRQTSLVPRSRIQNVTTSAGPLQTRFGVVTLTIHTAGARTRNAEVDHIDVGHAESIRRRLGSVDHG